ncbi:MULTISPECIES: hypothetical protein [Burkholderia cepacia complex]|uniref:hypothetical protein n=1 Tax=Burkholderia cepacia complex TaxID=87882 RepID=UPI0012DA5DB8|nr:MULTISPECIES: hypothetical protein [Burkholderia cepacia complex]MCA8037927.1 hypothetical protein [Burkholderia arboris]
MTTRSAVSTRERRCSDGSAEGVTRAGSGEKVARHPFDVVAATAAAIDTCAGRLIEPCRRVRAFAPDGKVGSTRSGTKGFALDESLLAAAHLVRRASVRFDRHPGDVGAGDASLLLDSAPGFPVTTVFADARRRL